MNLVFKLLFLVLIILFLYNNINIETFLSPGKYPLSLDKPLLYEDYNVKKNPKLDKSTQNIYKNYPIFPSNSLKNNNIRYWDLPTNGTCTPPDFCMSLYDKTHQKQYTHQEPKNPGFAKKRVNFFNYNN
jgi:hypothetical protein